MTSTLDLVALGLVLADLPLGSFEELVVPKPPHAEPRLEEPSTEEQQSDGKTTIIEKGAEEVDAAIVD